VHADPGIRLESGFLSESFVTDARTAACVLEEPFILLCDFKLVSMKELLPVLESVAEKGRALLIIADAVEGEALTTLTVNVQRGSLKSCAIRAPGFGDRRTRLLGDLAALTGAELLNAASGRKLESARVSDLGTARKAIISADDTTLLEAGGDRAAVERRSERVRAELLRAKDPSARAALQERLAVLAGAVASVQVAGVTPTDTRELADDAVHGLRSVESAIRSGWLPGGGWPEVFASIHATTLEDLDNADHAAGECLAAALRAPCAFLSATAFEIVDPAELRLYAAKVVAEGVLDSTAVVTGALATAWSHVRAVLETAVWDFGTGAAAVERDDAASVPDFGDM
jgi:chaperonin GroEL